MFALKLASHPTHWQSALLVSVTVAGWWHLQFCHWGKHHNRGHVVHTSSDKWRHKNTNTLAYVCTQEWIWRMLLHHTIWLFKLGQAFVQLFHCLFPLTDSGSKQNISHSLYRPHMKYKEVEFFFLSINKIKTQDCKSLIIHIWKDGKKACLLKPTPFPQIIIKSDSLSHFINWPLIQLLENEKMKKASKYLFKFPIFPRTI